MRLAMRYKTYSRFRQKETQKKIVSNPKSHLNLMIFFSGYRITPYESECVFSVDECFNWNMTTKRLHAESRVCICGETKL